MRMVSLYFSQFLDIYAECAEDYSEVAEICMSLYFVLPFISPLFSGEACLYDAFVVILLQHA